MSALSAPHTAVPRRIGPYTVIARLDGGDRSVPHGLSVSPVPPVPENRFIARSADGERTVLVGVPRAGADRGRFAAEAEASRYLLGPWSAPATETDASSEVPWHARPYVPALPLPTALAVHGGPLPEHTVRALGAALVETLAILHGQGLTHAGLSPAAVLLAADGPRLTCFGAVRAAAADGEPRSGHPALESGSLPPEQAAGERPHPMGDIYALGAVLAYAATGHTVPERDELPPTLRGPVSACLSRDPAARPQAAALLEAFTASDTVDATAGSRAAGLLGAGWLPGRVIAAIARQSAAVLAAEIPVESGPGGADPATAVLLESAEPVTAVLPAPAEPVAAVLPEPGAPGTVVLGKPAGIPVEAATVVLGEPAETPAEPVTIVLAEPAHRARTDR